MKIWKQDIDRFFLCVREFFAENACFNVSKLSLPDGRRIPAVGEAQEVRDKSLTNSQQVLLANKCDLDADPAVTEQVLSEACGAPSDSPVTLLPSRFYKIL